MADRDSSCNTTATKVDTKVEFDERKAKDIYFNNQYGDFSTPIDKRTKTSELCIGNLQIGKDEKNLKKFVFVPEKFQFTHETIELLYAELGINAPDLIFRFDENYSVVPSFDDKKTIEEWQDTEPFNLKNAALNAELQVEEKRETNADSTPVVNISFDSDSCQQNNASLSVKGYFGPEDTGKERNDLKDLKSRIHACFPDPILYAKKIKKARNDTRSVIRSIADFKKTVFLITAPFKGNEFSEIALDTVCAESNSTVQSIGLFHSDSTEILDGCLSVLKEKGYENKIEEQINEDRKNREFSNFCDRTRIPIPCEVFRHYSTTEGSGISKKINAIRVDCELSPKEEKMKSEYHGITRIPGGLAGKCDHCLVFSSKKQMTEFTKFFCDTCPTGYFACGGSHKELTSAKEALDNDKPLFAIEGTGFVPTIVNHLVTGDTTSGINKTLMKVKRKRCFEVYSQNLEALVIKNTTMAIKMEDELEFEELFLDLVLSLNANIFEVIKKDDEKSWTCYPLQSLSDNRNPTLHSGTKLTNTEKKICCTESYIQQFWWWLMRKNEEYYEDKFFKLDVLPDPSNKSSREGHEGEGNTSENCDASGDFNMAFTDDGSVCDGNDGRRRTTANNDKVELKEVSIKEVLRDNKRMPRGSKEVQQILRCKNPSREGHEGEGNTSENCDASGDFNGKGTMALTDDGSVCDGNDGRRRTTANNDKVELKEVSIKEVPRDNKRMPRGSKEVQQILRSENQSREYKEIYQILRRKNSSGKYDDSWILIEVSTKTGIDDGLKGAKMISHQLKNFMNFPSNEASISQLFNKEGVPIIIHIDSDCRIIRCRNATSIFGKEVDKPGTNLCKILSREIADNIDLKNLFDSFVNGSVLTPRTLRDMKVVRRNDSEDKSGGADQKERLLNLLLRFIPSHDSKMEILLGAYFIFVDDTRIEKTNPKTPPPMDNNTLALGEVLVASDRNAINPPDKSSSFHLIKSQSNSSELKSKISEIMSTALHKKPELDGVKKDHDAIDACLKLTADARRARTRYRGQAVFFHFAAQVLVLVTTILTVLKLQCGGTGPGQNAGGSRQLEESLQECECMNGTSIMSTLSSPRLLISSSPAFCEMFVNKREYTLTAFIIILPILAAVFQTLIYTFRPKLTSYRLMLLEKKLESEMFKFRARVSPYNIFYSQRKGRIDVARKKFVERCQEYYRTCMSSDFKDATMNANCKIYELHVKPCLESCWSKMSHTFQRCCCKEEISSDQLFQQRSRSKSGKRQKQRLTRVAKRTQELAERNLDLEAQLEGDHSEYLSDEQKDLLSALKYEETRLANSQRKEKDAKDYKEIYCNLSIDEYKRTRLEPQFNILKSRLPQMVFSRNALQALVIILTSGSTLFAALPTAKDKHLAFWIPILLSSASFFGNMLSFFRYETLVPVLHEICIGGLKEAILELNSPATLERSLQPQKDIIVNMVEDSILSYYSAMVEEQSESGKDNAKGDATDQENAITPHSRADDIRSNGNSNREGDSARTAKAYSRS